MERTLKLKYSDIYFSVLNTVIGCKQDIKSAFQKGRTLLLYCTTPCEYSIARWC